MYLIQQNLQNFQQIKRNKLQTMNIQKFLYDNRSKSNNIKNNKVTHQHDK